MTSWMQLVNIKQPTEEIIWKVLSLRNSKGQYTDTHTTVLWIFGFCTDLPLDPVPEETFTHSHLSWSSIILYLLPPSNAIHGIHHVQFTHTHTHTTVLLHFWHLSGTTRVSRYQKGKTRKGKTNLDLLEQEVVSGSGICWVYASLHLVPDDHANIPPCSFLQVGCPSCRPTNSVKAPL